MAENDELLHLADYVTAGLSAPAVRHKARNHLDHITMCLFAAERSLDADDGDRARAALAEAASTVVEISRTIDELRPPRPGRAQVNLAQAFLDAAATAKGVLIAANAQIAVTPAAIDVQTNPDTVRSLFVHLLMLPLGLDLGGADRRRHDLDGGRRLRRMEAAASDGRSG